MQKVGRQEGGKKGGGSRGMQKEGKRGHRFHKGACPEKILTNNKKRGMEVDNKRGREGYDAAKNNA